MSLDSAPQIWVVRHTKLLLVSWFMGLLCVAVWAVLWPTFDQYVERLKTEAQWQDVQAELAALDARARDQQAALEALEADWPAIEFQSLTAEIGSFADHIDVKRTSDHWTFILTGESSMLVRIAHALATELSGTELAQLSFDAQDEALRMTVRLQLTDQPVRRGTQFAGLSAEGSSAIRFGEIQACPSLRVVSRFGDAVHVEGSTGRQWMQFGDLVDSTWQLIGVREGQLMFKSDIGGVCFAEAAFS